VTRLGHYRIAAIVVFTYLPAPSPPTTTTTSFIPTSGKKRHFVMAVTHSRGGRS